MMFVLCVVGPFPCNSMCFNFFLVVVDDLFSFVFLLNVNCLILFRGLHFDVIFSLNVRIGRLFSFPSSTSCMLFIDSREDISSTL